MRNKKWLNGCNIVLSGCSSGIGRQLAVILCKEYSCKVMGLARSQEKLQTLKDEIGDKFDYMAIDISNRDNWLQIYNKLVEIDFRPDVLINNAGIIHNFTKFRTLSEEMIKKTMDTNFYSVVHSIKIMLPLLDNSPKRAIVNVASAAAYLACPGVSIYTASKSATLAFSEALYEELCGEGYYVGAVMPGAVKTDLYGAHGTKNGETLVKDDFIASNGISAVKAAKKIVWGLKRCKKRITVGFSAYAMNAFHRLLPSFSTTVMGKVFRKAPLTTYREMFSDEIKPASAAEPTNDSELLTTKGIKK